MTDINNKNISLNTSPLTEKFVNRLIDVGIANNKAEFFRDSLKFALSILEPLQSNIDIFLDKTNYEFSVPRFARKRDRIAGRSYQTHKWRKKGLSLTHGFTSTVNVSIELIARINLYLKERNFFSRSELARFAFFLYGIMMFSASPDLDLSQLNTLKLNGNVKHILVDNFVKYIHTKPETEKEKVEVKDINHVNYNGKEYERKIVNNKYHWIPIYRK